MDPMPLAGGRGWKKGEKARFHVKQESGMHENDGPWAEVWDAIGELGVDPDCRLWSVSLHLATPLAIWHRGDDAETPLEVLYGAAILKVTDQWVLVRFLEKTPTWVRKDNIVGMKVHEYPEEMRR